jgi:hypothetical protein
MPFLPRHLYILYYLPFSHYRSEILHYYLLFFQSFVQSEDQVFIK